MEEEDLLGKMEDEWWNLLSKEEREQIEREESEKFKASDEGPYFV